MIHASCARIEHMASTAKPPRHVRVVPVTADTVPAEWLIPEHALPDRALRYIHGGAWFVGSTNTHRRSAAELALRSGVRGLAINYRLAPERPFPAGLDDCVAAYGWLRRDGCAADKIVVAGDSAGGNLALLIALRGAGKPLPAGAVAISPATDLTYSGECHSARGHLDPLPGSLRPGAPASLKRYMGEDHVDVQRLRHRNHQAAVFMSRLRRSAD